MYVYENEQNHLDVAVHFFHTWQLNVYPNKTVPIIFNSKIALSFFSIFSLLKNLLKDKDIFLNVCMDFVLNFSVHIIRNLNKYSNIKIKNCNLN